MTTSFGWKPKKVNRLAPSEKFNEGDQIEESTADLDDVDWLHNLPIKRKKLQLENIERKVTRLTQEGTTLANQERYWEAIKKFDEALELKNDTRYKLLEMKAQALLQVNELYPAVITAEKAVHDCPTWWPSYQTLGRAQINIGEIELAIQTFSKAIHIQPDCNELWADDLHWAQGIMKEMKARTENQLTDAQLNFKLRETVRLGGGIPETSHDAGDGLLHDYT